MFGRIEIAICSDVLGFVRINKVLSWDEFLICQTNRVFCGQIIICSDIKVIGSDELGFVQV